MSDSTSPRPQGAPPAPSTASPQPWLAASRLRSSSRAPRFRFGRSLCGYPSTPGFSADPVPSPLKQTGSLLPLFASRRGCCTRLLTGVLFLPLLPEVCPADDFSGEVTWCPPVCKMPSAPRPLGGQAEVLPVARCPPAPLLSAVSALLPGGACPGAFALTAHGAWSVLPPTPEARSLAFLAFSFQILPATS